MSQRHSLPFSMPGFTGRKTGISVYGTPKRGANGLEDLNNFYLSDDDISEDKSNASTNTHPTSPMKRLSLYSARQSKQQLDNKVDDSAIVDESREPQDDDNNLSSFDDEIKSAEELGPPIKINASDLRDGKLNLKSGSKLTKNIALNKSSKSKPFDSQLIVNEMPENSRLSLVTIRKRVDNDSSSSEINQVPVQESEMANADLHTGKNISKRSDDIPVEAEEIMSDPIDLEDDNAGQLDSKKALTDKTFEPMARETPGILSIKTPEPIDDLIDENEASKDPVSVNHIYSIETLKQKSPHQEINSLSNSVLQTETANKEDSEQAESLKAGSILLSTDIQSTDDTTDKGFFEEPNTADSNVKDLSNSPTMNLASVTNDKTEDPITSVKRTRLIPRRLKPHPLTATQLNASLKKVLLKENPTKAKAVKSVLTEEEVKVPEPRRSRTPNERGLKDVIANVNSRAKPSPKRKSRNSAISNTKEKSTESDLEIVKVTSNKSTTSSQKNTSKAIENTAKISKEKSKAKPRTISKVSQIEPTRRSTRHRVPPVASWKNEKVVYKTEKVNGVYVKTVQDIEAIEIGSEEPEIKPKLPRTTRKGSLTGSSKKRTSKEETSNVPSKEQPPVKKLRISKSLKPKSSINVKKEAKPKKEAKVSSHMKVITSESEQESDSGSDIEEKAIPGTEWQTHSSMSIPVFEGPGTGTQVERIVAWAPNKSKNVTLINNEDENFRISTLFDADSEFCGAGLIEIASGDKKAVKSNNDTYFIFHVISGSLSVSINNTMFAVTKGCTFEIPMGNYYQFVNNGSKTVKLLFVQAKYVVIGESESESDSESEPNDD